MMTKGGRIATARGAMLADPALLGNSLDAGEALFDPDFWAARGELEPAPGGRGSAWFIGPAGAQWVLRHYRRGGFMARLSEDRYGWWTENRVRAFAEFRLLETMRALALPVPPPVGARYRRQGLTYRCDLITVRITAVRSLATALAAGPLARELWRAVGATIARFHGFGIEHADLNAHNILCATLEERISLIDFDRGRRHGAGAGRHLAGSGAWRRGNLERLHRSLLKVAPAGHFTPREWAWLMEGYG